ncbi:MAG TPA: hypothetical protein VIH18_02380 [Candidatus Binatia bacterium]|jgi:hypothetical protein
MATTIKQRRPSAEWRQIDLARAVGYQRYVFSDGKQRARWRVIGLLLVLAFFTLPLHAHAAAEGPRIVKECSCIHGQRTEVGIVPGGVFWLPQVFAVPCEVHDSQASSYSVLHSFAIRAPPLA